MPRTTRRTRAARAIAAATGRSYQDALEQLRTGRPAYTVTGPLPVDAVLFWVLAQHATTPMTVVGEPGSGRLLLAEAVGQTTTQPALPHPLPSGHTLVLLRNRDLAGQADARDLLTVLTGRDLSSALRDMASLEALVLTPAGGDAPTAGDRDALVAGAVDALRTSLLSQVPQVGQQWLRVDMWGPGAVAAGAPFRLRMTVLDPLNAHVRAWDVPVAGVVQAAVWSLHHAHWNAATRRGWTHARLLCGPDGQLHFGPTRAGEPVPDVPLEPVDVAMAPGSGKSVRMVQVLATGMDPAGFRPR